MTARLLVSCEAQRVTPQTLLCCAAQANGVSGTGPVVHFALVGTPPTPPTPPGTTSLRAKSDKLSRRCSNLDDACLLDIKSCASLARADTACTMSTWRGLAPYAGKLGALPLHSACISGVATACPISTVTLQQCRLQTIRIISQLACALPASRDH